jgi:hypothetical protein
MSHKAILVTKAGEIRNTSVRPSDIPTLYKRCGFRSDAGFARQNVWKVGSKEFVLYGKKNGKANTENKYDLPPPADNDLYFGSLVVVALENNQHIDIEVDEWQKTYDVLFGGFEDLASTAKEDAEEEDELANYSKDELTKTGYLKDGWIVDDGDSSGLEEEEYA